MGGQLEVRGRVEQSTELSCRLGTHDAVPLLRARVFSASDGTTAVLAICISPRPPACMPGLAVVGTT